MIAAAILLPLMSETILAAARNKHASTFAHGGLYAGEIDVSFGSTKTVDAQNFDKGQAIGVANFCGLVRTGGNEPASLNAMSSSPASAHDLNGSGGASGRVSSLTFLSPGIHDAATTGRFCLYKDAADGFWSVERKAVGGIPDDPGAGIKACAPRDVFHPAKGCFASTQKASLDLPDWKITRGTIVGMQREGRICYVGLINGRGDKAIELADQQFCKDTHLIGRKVQLTLKPGRIPSTSCNNRRNCTKTDRAMLIESVTILKKYTSKKKGGVCKNSGTCDRYRASGDHLNCLVKLAEQQNMELDKLYAKVGSSLKKRDQVNNQTKQKTWPKFRIAQINWQTFRDSACDTEFWIANKSTQGESYISNCLCNLSYHRKLDLKRMLIDYGE